MKSFNEVLVDICTTASAIYMADGTRLSPDSAAKILEGATNMATLLAQERLIRPDVPAPKPDEPPEPPTDIPF